MQFEIEIIRAKKALEEVKKWTPVEATPQDVPGHTYAASLEGEIVAIAALRLCSV